MAIRFDPESLGDREFRASDPLTPPKQWHMSRYTYTFFKKKTDAVASGSETHTLFQGTRAGRIDQIDSPNDCYASLDDTGTASSDVRFKLQKNGVDITNEVTFTHSDADRAQKQLTFNDENARAYTAGDVVAAIVNGVTITGTPKGPMVSFVRVESGD